MNEVECWYHFFFDRQACNNSAAYLFLAQVGSILSNYGFQAGCHPPRQQTVSGFLASNGGQPSDFLNSAFCFGTQYFFNNIFSQKNCQWFFYQRVEYAAENYGEHCQYSRSKETVEIFS